MYCLIDFCCICFCNKEHLQHLSDSDSDNITYLTKLTSCVNEMCFNEMYNQWLICNKCCETMDVAYKFRQRCLKSKATLTDYMAQLRQISNISGTASVYLSDINKIIDVKKENREKNNIKKNQLLIYKVKDANDEENFDINPIIDINMENKSNSLKLIDTGDISIPFENVVIKMERENRYFEENIDESCDNPLINHDNNKIDSQNDILTTSAIKKENKNFEERLHERFDNILEKCDGANGDMEIKVGENDDLNTEKYSNDPLINLNEIKIDIAEKDIESLNDEINIECKSEYNAEFTKEDPVNPLDDEDKTDNDTNSCLTSVITSSKKTSNKLSNPLHKNPQKFSEIKTHTSHTEDKAHECSVCEKKFNKLRYLKKHFKIHSGEKLHECSFCHSKFTESFTLTEHIKIHTGDKPHVCRFCHSKFAQSSSLTEHIRIHTGEKPYQCEICRKKFSRSNSLKKHIGIHTGIIKSHECSVCKKKFRDAYTLKKHMITHSAEKTHECSICHKKFMLFYYLKAHMKTHSGERPYECTVCGKKCSQAVNLRIHMRIHTGERPYECTVCQKTFNQSVSLKYHKQTHATKKT